MSNVISNNGYFVVSSDLNDFNYGIPEVDFLKSNTCLGDWIITNPPFKESEAFIRKCISFKVPFALLLKSQYWHSKNRLKLFNDHVPKYILPLTWRPDFLYGQKGGSPTMECLWTVWDSEPSITTEYIPLKKHKI
jgi:hypothetical protein